MVHSRTKDKMIHGLFFLNGVLVIIVLMGIFVLLLTKSIPAFKEIHMARFLFSANWNPTATFVAPTYGIWSMIISTFMVSLGALGIALPLGIGTAAYLSDAASPKVREVMKPVIEILAGVPSVVIGFLGIVLWGHSSQKHFT